MIWRADRAATLLCQPRQLEGGRVTDAARAAWSALKWLRVLPGCVVYLGWGGRAGWRCGVVVLGGGGAVPPGLLGGAGVLARGGAVPRVDALIVWSEELQMVGAAVLVFIDM